MFSPFFVCLFPQLLLQPLHGQLLIRFIGTDEERHFITDALQLQEPVARNDSQQMLVTLMHGSGSIFMHQVPPIPQDQGSIAAPRLLSSSKGSLFPGNKMMGSSLPLLSTSPACSAILKIKLRDCFFVDSDSVCEVADKTLPFGQKRPVNQAA